MIDFLKPESPLAWWFLGISVGMFLVSLVAIPIIVVRLPADFFCRRDEGTFGFQKLHPAARIALIVVKNLLGLLMLAAGIAMLVLPGQGILGILLGVSLLDFPGKRRLQRRIVRQKPVLRSINWIRRKAGRPPIRIRSDEGQDSRDES